MVSEGAKLKYLLISPKQLFQMSFFGGIHRFRLKQRNHTNQLIFGALFFFWPAIGGSEILKFP